MSSNQDPPRSLLLKELSSSEKDAFVVMLSCFDEGQEAVCFMRANDIDLERVVFFGKADAMTEPIAKASVSEDHKRQIENLMRGSLDLYAIVAKTGEGSFFKDYRSGEHTIGDALASYRTAVEMLGNKKVALIYLRRR